MKHRLRNAMVIWVAGVVAAGSAPLPSVPAADGAAAALLAEVLSSRSHFESDLRRLTDEIGGRPTGSGAYEKALAWGVEAFRKAGLTDVRLESYAVPALWEGGAVRVEVVAPSAFPLRGVSFALGPSTAGTITASLLDAGFGKKSDFERLGDRARGSVLLVRTNLMKSFADLFQEYLDTPDMLAAAKASGAAALLVMSTRPRHLLYRHVENLDGNIGPVPVAQISREDADRLSRLFESGQQIRISLSIQNRITGPGRAQNVVAELPGAEKRDEVVLLGAHLDSWDLGTGALDNGVNCALVIEAARAIAAGPRPKRTIRFVLFTGEENGLLGSLGYVRAHRTEMDRHVAVLIHDIGDGRVTGYYDNGRPELAAALKRILAPLANWRADGLNDEAVLGTDNFDFLLEGVPNLVADQEAERYLPDYHASSDTFDKVDLREARLNTAIAAVATAGLANAPDRLAPRQSREEVRALLEKSGLEKQMKTYGLWADWQKGERGRATR